MAHTSSEKTNGLAPIIGLAMNQSTPRSRQLMTFDVAIVGGGFAGVTAARDLAAAGRSVVILEARDRLGGRTWYRPFAGTEHGVELGGTWFSLSRQPPLAEEVDRYGVRVVPAATRLCARWHTGGVTRHGLPVPQSEGAALERMLRSPFGCLG